MLDKECHKCNNASVMWIGKWEFCLYCGEVFNTTRDHQNIKVKQFKNTPPLDKEGDNEYVPKKETSLFRKILPFTMAGMVIFFVLAAEYLKSIY